MSSAESFNEIWCLNCHKRLKGWVLQESITIICGACYKLLEERNKQGLRGFAPKIDEELETVNSDLSEEDPECLACYYGTCTHHIA